MAFAEAELGYLHDPDHRRKFHAPAVSRKDADHLIAQRLCGMAEPANRFENGDPTAFEGFSGGRDGVLAGRQTYEQPES